MVTPAAKREAVAHLQTRLGMRERRACRLRNDDPSLRQFHVRGIIDRVEVGRDEIQIVEATKALERSVASMEREPRTQVRNIERKWRTRQDYN